MNQPPDTPEKRRRIYFGLALVLFGCCGCAASEAHLGSATKVLAVAENEQPLFALGHDLLAAKISFNVLEQFPNDESARNPQYDPQAIREVERILKLNPASSR